MKALPKLLLFSLFICCLWCSNPLAHSAEQIPLTPPDIARIISQGKIRVAVINYESPPFIMTTSEGELVGIDIEIAKSLAKTLHVEVEFVRTSQTTDGLIDMVMNREADIAISEITFTFNRAKKVSFSNPYLTMHQSLLINRSYLRSKENTVSLFAFLNKKETKVAYLTKSVFSEWANNLLPDATPVSCGSWEEVIQEIIHGQANVAVVDEPLSISFGITYPAYVINVESVNILDKKDYISIAVPWNDYNLRQLINRFLDTDYPNLHLQTLMNKYSSYFSEENAFKLRGK